MMEVPAKSAGVEDAERMRARRDWLPRMTSMTLLTLATATRSRSILVTS